ncbi:ankyrin repeat-containing protein BDA1-like [Diospyros lotus]|uniref:ankyrin repeat-containing protein BDA1-like n=1 Tax=Diospyros lotus TaxID=55363 RepID=UPI00224FCF11|nr:ankyrin repeat-containing protein BDA1-like [Diospyros lotus]
MDACYQTLVEAINAGNLQVLHQLLQENPFILTDISLLPPPEPLLCVATRAGRLNFVRELVRHRAELAKELNSDGLRPLDIAAVNGNVEIVRELVKNDAEMCRLKGKDKRTALHHAAVHGRVEVIDVLVYVCSESIKDVTAKGETALHLAVKSGQFEAFRALVDWLLRSGEEAIINRGDCEENTVLHLAASTKQLEVIKLLLDRSNSTGVKVDVNAQNSRGLTAVNILNDIKKPTPAEVGLRNDLKSASAVASKSPVESPLGTQVQNLLLVVAVLFVTITFQGVIDPPQYIFSTDSSVGNSSTSTSGNTTTTPNTTSGNTINRNPAHSPATMTTIIGIIVNLSASTLFLFFNTLVHTAAFTTIELVTRRLVFRRELLVSSFCVSFLYGSLVAKLAKKESVPSYVLLFAIFLSASMRLLPEWAFKVWKWLRQRREERRWTQNNAG